jgi:hypothetical protein
MMKRLLALAAVWAGMLAHAAALVHAPATRRTAAATGRARPLWARDALSPEPTPDQSPEEVITLVMDALMTNDAQDSGIVACWTFSSDMCRASLGGSLDEFKEYTRNPTFATMVRAAEVCAGVFGSGFSPTAE